MPDEGALVGGAAADGVDLVGRIIGADDDLAELVAFGYHFDAHGGGADAGRHGAAGVFVAEERKRYLVAGFGAEGEFAIGVAVGGLLRGEVDDGNGIDGAPCFGIGHYATEGLGLCCQASK